MEKVSHLDCSTSTDEVFHLSGLEGSPCHICAYVHPNEVKL